MAQTANIIVDATNVAHIAKHAMRGMSYGEKGDTGTVFGFLVSVLSLHKRFGHDARFLFAWDSRGSLRRRDFPDYKQKRRERATERTEQEEREDNSSRAQMMLLHKDVLPRIGFRNSYLYFGYEADDVTAALAAQLAPPSTIVSTDKDMFQCLRPGVELLNPISKRVTTEGDFKEEWGLEPSDWATVLAIAGCDTDDVPGVEGVGLITAAKYLRGDLSDTAIARQRINKELVLIERNRRLVTLPYGRLSNGALPVKPRDEFDQAEAEAVFREYGFESFLRDPLKTAWERLLVF